MCDCANEISRNVFKMIMGCKTSSFMNINLLDGTTFSNIEVEIEGRKKKKLYPVMHVYCPFCGNKYKENKNE